MPIIAGRRIALSFRWAQPDGVLELYQAGSEGPQWWHKFPDHMRGLPPAGNLDRCDATGACPKVICPKVIEHFGSAEDGALKLTPEWVGTDAKNDILLPANVRRYYIVSSSHGGGNNNAVGAAGFNASLAGSLLAPPGCPGNNFRCLDCRNRRQQRVEVKTLAKLRQRVVQHLHPMLHRGGGAALQVLNAADVGRDDDLRLAGLQMAELALAQLLGQHRLQH